MTSIVWTHEALARLDDIEAYIALDSPAAARAMIARLIARTRQLETTPLSGRQVPDYRREDIRELLERPYRIIYHIAPPRIVILTVLHYRRLLPRKAEVLRHVEKD